MQLSFDVAFDVDIDRMGLSCRLGVGLSETGHRCSATLRADYAAQAGPCLDHRQLRSIDARQGVANQSSALSTAIRRIGGRPMAVRTLEKQEWHGYFDRISRGLLGERAEIEVASLQLGDQIEAEWAPLLGITYDPKDDVLEVALDGLDHLIPRPRQIFVDEGLSGLASFEVVDHTGVRHIVQLREPLMLPPPAPLSSRHVSSVDIGQQTRSVHAGATRQDCRGSARAAVRIGISRPHAAAAAGTGQRRVDRAPVLSFYLQLTPQRRIGGAWRTYLSSMSDTMLRSIEDSRMRQALREEFGRIEHAMEQELPVLAAEQRGEYVESCHHRTDGGLAPLVR